MLVHETLVPPDSIEGLSPDQIAPFRTEYDVVSSLRSLGHKVRPLGLGGDLSVIDKAVEEFRPDICFNLLEEFAGEAVYDQNVVSYLELLGLPYTGCGPRGLMLARDKGLSKKVMAYHRIPAPDFVVFPRGRAIRTPSRPAFPLFVKSLNEEASLGISQASIVQDEDSLRERVTFIHERIGTDAIAEQFVPGRELYIGVLGNRSLKVLPVWELVFERMAEDAPHIATARAKWDRRYQQRWGITSRRADLPEGLARRIGGIARRVYRCLGMSGYGRIDLRLTPEGQVYVLEANANPQIAQGEDFADSAAACGVSYQQLMQQILSLGLRRKRQPVLA